MAVVMKFGGTSVGTAERLLNVASIVRNASATKRVVVVLSAMSGSTKASGTTSRLLEAAALAVSHNSASPPLQHASVVASASSAAPAAAGVVSAPGNTSSFQEIIRDIEREHLAAARAAISDKRHLEEVELSMASECQRLRSFLEATQVIGEMSPRSRDVVIGTGEKLSCLLLTAVLRDQGVAASYVNLERVIEKDFGRHELDHRFYSYLRSSMVDRIDPLMLALDCVPVVTGYFGFVPNGIVNTVGRGYTDFTASLVAAGLQAHELQIWKEVDGIFSADPTKVARARVLTQISPAEAAELSFFGAEVIHPFTMEQAINARIPIRIKNTFKPDGHGTLILPDSTNDANESEDEVGTKRGLPGGDGNHDDLKASKRHKSGDGKDKLHRHPTAVTIKSHVLVVNVRSNRKSLAHDFLEHIFAILNRHGVVVDLISTSEVLVSMALATSKENELQTVIKELNTHGKVNVFEDMAIVSLVGKEMRHMVGIAGKMFTALAEAHVNIALISQGASEINISCVIAQADSHRALNAIHDKLVHPVELQPVVPEDASQL